MPIDLNKLKNKEWFESIFIYKDITLTHVLYFDSRMWYIGKENDKNIMVWFGHNQPTAKNISLGKYIDLITFNSFSELPSTIVPLTDVVEIMSNATINDIATSIIENEKIESYDNSLYQSVIDNFNNLNNETISLILRKIENMDYNLRYKYKFLKESILDGSFLTSLILNQKTNTRQINNNTSVLNSMPIADHLNVFLGSKDYKERNENCIHKTNIFNNLNISINDNSKDYESREVMIIGHAIRIGILNNDLLYSRYNNIFNSTDQNKILVNTHNTSIEMDNDWKYTNHMMLTSGEDSLDENFYGLEKTDININPLRIKRFNISELSHLSFEIDERLNEKNKSLSDEEILNISENLSVEEGLLSPEYKTEKESL